MFMTDAQGVGQGRQGVNGPRREYRAVEIGYGTGGDEELPVCNGLAVGDDLAPVEIQASGCGGKKVHAGGEPFPQGTGHDPLRHPAAGQVGQGGQHGGDGTGIHQQDVPAVPRENPAGGLEACEAERNYYKVNCLPIYPIHADDNQFYNTKRVKFFPDHNDLLKRRLNI